MGVFLEATEAGTTKFTARRRVLSRACFIVSVWLLVQFVLGMFVNLFVKVPTTHPGANPPEYFSGVVQSVAWAIPDGGLWLTLHAVVGLLLVLMAIGTLVLAIRAHTGVVTCSLGLLFVLAAGFNGGSFLNYNEDVSSMIMAGFFALALGGYVTALYRGAENERRAVLHRTLLHHGDDAAGLGEDAADVGQEA
jgi:hypothetical protein